MWYAAGDHLRVRAADRGAESRADAWQLAGEAKPGHRGPILCLRLDHGCGQVRILSLRAQCRIRLWLTETDSANSAAKDAELYGEALSFS